MAPVASPQRMVNASPMSIPRLPLDAGGGCFASPPECSPSFLPPTVRNHAGHESRSALATARTTSSLPLFDPDVTQAPGYRAETPLDPEEPCPQWSTPTLPPMTARNSEPEMTSSSVRTIIPDNGDRLGDTTSTLARTMGHFGPPEPPARQQMVASPSASSIVTQPPTHGIHAEVSAFPDESDKQSFVMAVASSPHVQADSFLQPSAQVAGRSPSMPCEQKCTPSGSPPPYGRLRTPVSRQRSRQGRPFTHGASEAEPEEGAAGMDAAIRIRTRSENSLPEKAVDNIERALREDGEVKPLHPRMRALPSNDVRRDRGPERSPERSPLRHGTPNRQTSASSRNRQRPGEKAADRIGVPGAPTPQGSDDVSIAIAAVSSRDLAELRSFRNPPAVVSQVLDAVAVLVLGPSADAARLRRCMDHGLLNKLRAVSPSQVTAVQAERLKVLLTAPAFSDGALCEKCPAAVSLANWCLAVGQSLKQSSPDPARAAVVRPDLDGLKVEPDLWSMTQAELACLHGLRFSRDGVGCVSFHGETDCRDILNQIADIVVLQPGEVVVYPNPGTKPPVGKGLNKSADIILYGCMPKTPLFKDKKAREKYKRRVRQMTEDKGAEFIDYDCDCGIWQFRVKHF